MNAILISPHFSCFAYKLSLGGSALLCMQIIWSFPVLCLHSVLEEINQWGFAPPLCASVAVWCSWFFCLCAPSPLRLLHLSSSFAQTPTPSIRLRALWLKVKLMMLIFSSTPQQFGHHFRHSGFDFDETAQMFRFWVRKQNVFSSSDSRLVVHFYLHFPYTLKHFYPYGSEGVD